MNAGALRGCRRRHLQRCWRRSARELSPGYHTLAHTPGGGVLLLHGSRSGVRRYIVVDLGDCLGALRRPGRPPGHVGGGVHCGCP